MFDILKEDFCVYYRPHDSLKSKIGSFCFTLLEPGFWAITLHRIAHQLFLYQIFLIPLILMRFNKLLTHVDINYQVKIGRRIRLPHCFDIVVGSTAVIGDDVEILNGVTLGAKELRGEGKRHPTLLNGVLVGSGAKILGDIIIGENVRIGANAVVLKSVPKFCVLAGIPAKIIAKFDSLEEMNA